MNGFKLLLGTVILLGCASQQSATRTEKPAPPQIRRELQQEIDAILSDSALSSCIIGIEVVSLENDSVLYQKNSKTLFHPASNMKLLTTSTALHMFPSTFNFTTTLSIDSLASDSTIQGNLYIKGSGDPLLTTNDLDSLAGMLSTRGIRSVTGNIVGDISYFDTVAWGKGWMWDDEPDPDEAFISPLTVNSNTITVTVGPGNRNGSPLNVTVTPSAHGCEIINTGITSRDTSYPELHVDRLRGKNTIIVEGRMSPAALPHEFTFSIREPAYYTLRLLRSKLLEHGITVRGHDILDTVSGKNPIEEISHSLDSVLVQTNKESDNIASENLLKALAAEYFHTAGTTEAGLSLIKVCLSATGIDTLQMRLADASGVSNYSVLSPHSIMQVLISNYHDKEFSERFVMTLPIAGVDGTLKNRMKGTAAAGNVRAKTGTLTGSSALSGYLITVDGVPLAFSILSNHFPDEVRVLRSMQDRIVETLALLLLRQQ